MPTITFWFPSDALLLQFSPDYLKERGATDQRLTSFVSCQTLEEALQPISLPGDSESELNVHESSCLLNKRINSHKKTLVNNFVFILFFFLPHQCESQR